MNSYANMYNNGEIKPAFSGAKFELLMLPSLLDLVSQASLRGRRDSIQTLTLSRGKP